MKQINVTMDANGHIAHDLAGGVMGDHHAATLCITLQNPPEQATYYRLYFAGESNTFISEQLFPRENLIQFSLPNDVTRLGKRVLGQLCAYHEANGEFTLVFKSTPFELSMAASLPDTGELLDPILINRLESMLNQVQTIADHFDLTIGSVSTLAFDQPATARLSCSDKMKYTLHLGIPKGEKGEGDFSAGEGISIINGEISVTPHQGVYSSHVNSYGYLCIHEDQDISDLAGRTFWVEPTFTNSNQALYICTYQQLFHKLYCFSESVLTDTFPPNAIVAGRPMQIYVNHQGQAIYLNPAVEPSSTTEV